MSLHEEQLIAMGMEQFTPYCTELLNDDAKVSSKENLVHTMISHYMLPHWTAKQIATRIKNKSFNNKRNKNESNPIKVSLSFYFLNIDGKNIFCDLRSIIGQIKWPRPSIMLSNRLIATRQRGYAMSQYRCYRNVGKSCFR